jgi:predicted amidophosphoribosyltransferase
MKETPSAVIPTDMELVLRPKGEESEVICEVCGAKNPRARQLCRVCSNYLENEEEEPEHE